MGCPPAKTSLALSVGPIYIANVLQYVKRQLKDTFLPLVAALLGLVVLLLNLLAVSPGLHERLHPDAGEHGHECAVTLFAHGQVDGVAVAVVPPLPLPGLALARPEFSSSPGTVQIILLSARGPPCAVTVS